MEANRHKPSLESKMKERKNRSCKHALKRGTKWKGKPSQGASSGGELGWADSSATIQCPKSRPLIGWFLLSHWPKILASLIGHKIFFTVSLPQLKISQLVSGHLSALRASPLKRATPR